MAGLTEEQKARIDAVRRLNRAIRTDAEARFVELAAEYGLTSDQATALVIAFRDEYRRISREKQIAYRDEIANSVAS